MAECEECVYYDTSILEDPCCSCGLDYGKYVPKHPEGVQLKMRNIVSEVDNYICQLEMEIRQLQNTYEKYGEYINELNQAYQKQANEQDDVYRRLARLEKIDIKRRK